MNSRPSTQIPRKLIRQRPPVERALPKIPCEPPAPATPVGTSHPLLNNNNDNNSHIGYRYTLLPVCRHHSREEPSSPSSIYSDTLDMSPPPSPCYQPEWIFRQLKTPIDNVTIEEPAWPGVIQPTPRVERSVPSFNSTGPNPSQTRPRGPSVSSSVATTSSLSLYSSKPPSPQSKSILTRTSSESTKNSLVKSVKFVDIPTIHYGYDDYEDSYDDCDVDISRPPTPPMKLRGKGRALRGFRRYIWPPPPKQSPSAPPPFDSPPYQRPAISGPFPLGSIQVDYSDNASLRSVRSNESNHSRPSSCGTFPLRTSRSTESFRTPKLSSNRLRTFFGKMVH